MPHSHPFSRLPHGERARFTRRRRAALVASLSVLSALAACSLGSPVTPVSTLTPAAMVLVSGNAQMGAAGNTLPIPVIVRVTDQGGVPVTGAPVSFSPAASSGTVSAPALFTDTTGSAGVVWTVGTALGADSLNVSVAGVPTVTVTATVAPGFPDSIAIVSGGAQTAPAGTTLNDPLVVKITDQFGNAVPNATVSWSSDANGAFASADALTDATGTAQAVYTLGASAGVQHVAVMVSTAAGARLATISETATMLPTGPFSAW
jgi:protocatechuate 3,4-dioxygenase beta subunit